MSRTYRYETKEIEERHSKGRMRRCEMCEAQFPLEAMYPILNEAGAVLGLVCEVCSADIELIEEDPDAPSE